MNKPLLAAVLVAGTAFSAPAVAQQYHMDSFTVAPGAQVVDITNPINNPNILAGQIVLHSTLDGNLTVWCLDLNDFLVKPYTFQESVYTGGARPGLPGTGLTALQIRQIASLMEFGLTVNPDGDSDAAVQLAIWKTEYGNNFSDAGLSISLAAKVAILLNDSLNGGLIDCPNCSLTVLSDAVQSPNQALGFATIAPVPAPIVGAGIPGIVAACGGLLGFNWRRRRQAIG